MTDNFAIAYTLFIIVMAFIGWSVIRAKIDKMKEAIILMDEQHKLDIITARDDAVNRSRAVLKGKITEHLAPYLPGFKYNAGDARFLGSPIDFIIFDGMSDGNIKSVIIMDIKTGNSRLNKNQRQIREVIREGQVSFETLRIE